VAIASGDALIVSIRRRSASQRRGLPALGAPASPAEAARHGVFCPNGGWLRAAVSAKAGRVRAKRSGRHRLDGRTVLDAGVMSFDGSAAARLLRAFRTPPAREAILSHGIDLYREVCCALGTEATLAHYVKTAREADRRWMKLSWPACSPSCTKFPCTSRSSMDALSAISDSTSQLISSGLELVAQDQGAPPATTILAIDDDVQANGGIDGREVWVEGCRLRAPLGLRGRNVVVGVDVFDPLELRKEPAWTSHRAWIERAARYVSSGAGGVDDTFKRPVAEGATFCGKPLAEWLLAAGAPVSGSGRRDA